MFPVSHSAQNEKEDEISKQKNALNPTQQQKKIPRLACCATLL